jgi:hypothetical protein
MGAPQMIKPFPVEIRGRVFAGYIEKEIWIAFHTDGTKIWREYMSEWRKEDPSVNGSRYNPITSGFPRDATLEFIFTGKYPPL